MSVEEQILVAVRPLSADRQREVLDFAQFLHFRQEPQNRLATQIEHWPKEFWEEVVGGWQGERLVRLDETLYLFGSSTR